MHQPARTAAKRHQTEAAVYYKSCSVCGAKSTDEKDTFSYGEALDHD